MNTPEHPRPVLVTSDRTEPSPPENTFGKWLRRLGIRMASLLSIGVISTAVSTIYSGVKNSWFTEAAKPNFGWLIPIISIIQLAVITLVLVSSIKGPSWLNEEEESEAPSFDDESLPGRIEKGDGLIKACGYKGLPKAKWREAKKIAGEAEDSYQILWKCLWFCWLLLYIMLAVQGIPGIFGDTNPDSVVKNVPLKYGLDVLSTFINNCAAVVILLTYFVLSKPTASINKKGTNKLYIEVIRWFTIAVVFSIIESAYLAVALNIFDTSVVHTVQSLSRYNQIESAFTWASGIFSATAMALYVGRIDSKYLGTPSWVLVFLYIYASIQPLYALLDSWPLAALILINAALIFKCVWFLYTAWLFQSHRLIFYFIRIRRLYEQINNDWNEFSKALHERKQAV